MSFREKAAWITLVTTIAVFGGYVATVGRKLFMGRGGEGGFVGPLVAATLLLVILQGVLMTIAAATDPSAAKEPRDERERMIALRGGRAGFYALQVGAFAAITTFFFWRDPLIMANAVFLAMGAGEAVRASSQLIDYHRAVV